MKRLLQIAFDTLLLSIVPIIMWNVVGILFEKELANVFAITYSVQFAFEILYYLFGVGANITAEKTKNENIVYTNRIIGLLSGIILTLVLILNCKGYLQLMNADYESLKIFTIYSIINNFYSFVLKLILEKLYYEKKNNLANKLSVFFNILNLSLFVILAFITRSQLIVTITTSTIMGFILLVIFIYNMKKFKFDLKLKENVKHSSSGIISNILLFITYFIGLYNEFSFGMQYMVVSNFISLTTDAQWDMLEAILTVAHIDASKKEFVMKQQVKNAYQLTVLLIISSIIMSLGLYPLYKPDLTIFTIAFLVQVVHMLFFPIYSIRIQYLQTNLNETKEKPGFHTGISRILTTLCSFIHNPYCTYIGQLVSAMYFYIYTKSVAKKVKEIQ